MLEVTWHAEYAHVTDSEKMDSAVPAEAIEEASEEELSKQGITPEMKEKMLRGEPVVAGAVCICLECQDRLFE